MLSLFLCPVCNEVMSNSSVACPFCGAPIGRGTGHLSPARDRHVPSQSIFAIVLDALRSCLRQRTVDQQLARTIPGPQASPEQLTHRTSRS